MKTIIRTLFLPSAAILFNLTYCTLTQRDAECIDYIDIVSARIFHVERAGVAAYDIVMPVVRGLFVRYTVCFRYARYTAVRNQLKQLRHAVVLIQIQVVRVIDSLIAVGVEIDRIISYLHLR